MKKYSFYLLIILGVLILIASCTNTNEIKSSIGKEVILSIGQSVQIDGEDLKISFKKILEDSRCAIGATCIWAGEITFVIEITYENSTEQITLAQPGLNDEPSKYIYKQLYELTYNIQPYPELNKQISDDEYRLELTINHIEYNAYVVSSEWRSAPIIDSLTGLSVGQAYNGFAVFASEVNNGNAYFPINISDPSVPTNIERMDLYIPIDYMIRAYVEPQNVDAIISLDVIRINPMAGISLFLIGKQQVIARFNNEIGPIRFIQNVDNGYIFQLGMNLVYVNEQDIRLTEYVD